MERKVTVLNRAGIHVRPSMKISDLANKFEADILLIKDKDKADAKSIMSILTLAASEGEAITIRAEGKDELKAIEEIAALIASKFSEE